MVSKEIERQSGKSWKSLKREEIRGNLKQCGKYRR